MKLIIKGDVRYQDYFWITFNGTTSTSIDPGLIVRNDMPSRPQGHDKYNLKEKWK